MSNLGHRIDKANTLQISQVRRPANTSVAPRVSQPVSKLYSRCKIHFVRKKILKMF